eukprot:GDKJ01003492.1.p1 GENE.GDKJ01003492.1~~GDKJ01003492.1.p1  ORF type:complete len:130 (+),score=33.54 GDKJ01003492.1:36-425(+)
MGKGLRSKVKRRYRAVQREVLERTVGAQRDKTLEENMEKLLCGEDIMNRTPKNKFFNPDDPEATIPQRGVTKPIDMRAESVYEAGYAYIGANRKQIRQEKAEKKAREVEEAIARRAAARKAKEMEMEMQ